MTPNTPLASADRHIMRTAVTAVCAMGMIAQPFSAVAAPAARRVRFEGNLHRSIGVAGKGDQRFTLAERMAHYRVPGVSVAVIEGCRIIDSRGFGLAAIGGAPVTATTRFQAASISKTLTAVAALRLVEGHRLDLDADVRRVLREWSLPENALMTGHPVTLRLLLNHTAGVNLEGLPGYAPGAPLPDLTHILAGAAPANTAPVRVETAPGSEWHYSGGGYLIAQAMMIDATGEAFPALMQRLVLRPARMGQSSFEQPAGAGLASHAASGAAADGSALPGRWHVYPELAAAGLWTTPTDLARFAIALGRSVRGEHASLLSATSAAALMTRGPGDWGLGVDLGRAGAARQFGHTGANLGYQSAYILYPDTCQGAVVMTNADDPGQLVTEIMRAIGVSYGWPDRKPMPVQADIPLTDAIARRFIGNWQLRDFPAERFRISRQPDGGLYWARQGHIGRDLLVENAGRLFSPDSRMTLTAAQPEQPSADTLALAFGGGANVAIRVD
jgi:CubicO group peptidase (beta-lactamase class C family)